MATIARHRVTPRGGPVLDLGTGPGTAAIELAVRGFRVTALDVSPTAIRTAQQRAGYLGPKIQWVVGDLFQRELARDFQLVHDRGVYHSLPWESRRAYPDRVAGWLRPGGLLVLKTFSPHEPGTWGPNRIPREELESNVGGRFELLELSPSTFPGTLDHEPLAWLAVYQAPRA